MLLREYLTEYTKEEIDKALALEVLKSESVQDSEKLI